MMIRASEPPTKARLSRESAILCLMWPLDFLHVDNYGAGVIINNKYLLSYVDAVNNFGRIVKRSAQSRAALGASSNSIRRQLVRTAGVAFHGCRLRKENGGRVSEDAAGALKAAFERAGSCIYRTKMEGVSEVQLKKPWTVAKMLFKAGPGVRQRRIHRRERQSARCTAPKVGATKAHQIKKNECRVQLDEDKEPCRASSATAVGESSGSKCPSLIY